MKTGEGFLQCDNAQAAVDAESQVIVGCSLSNRQNDYHRSSARFLDDPKLLMIG